MYTHTRERQPVFASIHRYRCSHTLNHTYAHTQTHTYTHTHTYTNEYVYTHQGTAASICFGRGAPDSNFEDE